MNRSSYCFRFYQVLFGLTAGWASCLIAADDPVRFDDQIRPILAKQCLNCHGRDQEHREAGLRLDTRDGATATLDSGNPAIVPGKPDESELWRRISTDDETVRMPPAETNQPLTPDQIELIQRWIREGADYDEHWSFVPPRSPQLDPAHRRPDQRHPIDLLVDRKLAERNLQRNGDADPRIAVRRLSLDLRGLPPTPDELREFADNDSPGAYDRAVDRFLHDPAFGERWARVWLDLARYADSRGYGSDPLRLNMWRYRDWVIQAFNDNLPYDQFTVEQLAGDLLPDATLDQRVATAFHRNTMTNTEGGTDDEEFRVAAVRDRIDTTVQVWMGLTMGCAKCHDHKYDPLTQQDYYRFYAVFNQTADADRPDESPVIDAPTLSTLLANERIDAQVTALRQEEVALKAAISAAGAGSAVAAPAAAAISGRFVRVELPGANKILSLAEVEVYANGANAARQGKAIQSSTDYDGPPGLAVDGNPDGRYNEAKSTTHTRAEDNPWWEVDLGAAAAIDRVVIWNRSDAGVAARLNGFTVQVLDEARQVVWSERELPAPTPSREWTLRPLSEAERQLQTLVQRIDQLNKSRPPTPTVPVLAELPTETRRASYFMLKGDFLRKGDPVEPGLPASFVMETVAAPSRLDAARWLTDRRNPLTARVAVNRIWAQLFGRGLVETEEDFGTQGDRPSNAELLDWLAVEFSQDWDVKRLLREIVLSSTYRQSAATTPEKLDADPLNQGLSRGPRFRLDAETIRDQALAVSGLLSRKIGGPSVYPYQPDGLWRASFNGERTWPTSPGEDKYRRGLYTFWRRTVPYPSLQTFDAPSREICHVRRLRTNTPLQAFVTLNDPVYVEAAQALARRLDAEGGPTPRDKAAFGIELTTCRRPSDQQLDALLSLYQSERVHYQANPAAAGAIAGKSSGSESSGANQADLAAWTIVANVLLNQDSFLNK